MVSRDRVEQWLLDEIRSLRVAPKINGCGPENWEEQLGIMESCLEAVRAYKCANIERDEWKCLICEKSKVISFKAWEDELAYYEGGTFIRGSAIFCPCCGKPRTQEALSELDKQMRM